MSFNVIIVSWQLGFGLFGIKLATVQIVTAIGLLLISIAFGLIILNFGYERKDREFTYLIVFFGVNCIFLIGSLLGLWGILNPYLMILAFIFFSQGFAVAFGLLNLVLFYLCFKTILQKNRNKRNFIALISISIFLAYNLVIFPFLYILLELSRFHRYVIIIQDIFIFLFGIAILLVKVDFNKNEIFENNSEKGIEKK